MDSDFTPDEKKVILNTIKEIGEKSMDKLTEYEQRFNDFESIVLQLENSELNVDTKLFESQFRDILSLDFEILCAKLCSYDYKNIVNQPEFVTCNIIAYITGFRYGADPPYDYSYMRFNQILGYDSLNNDEAIKTFICKTLEIKNELSAQNN